MDVETARAALADLPDGTSHGDRALLNQVYVPPSHLKALHPDNLLVTGMRGAGKTFWWGALQDEAVRTLVGQQSTRSPVIGSMEVRTGFGVTLAPDQYPGRHVLTNLMLAGFEPKIIWRTVQAYQLAGAAHELRKRRWWRERVAFVDRHPEAIDRLFYETDVECDRRGTYLVILFDALDRCSDDWREMYRAIRGLLQTALDMRSYRRLRVKVFLRTDQADWSRIADFPDASKVLSSAVELNWPRRDLYGLLWHLLANGNGEHGEAFRSFLTPTGWETLTVGSRSVFSLPRSVLKEDHQRSSFHAISGRWMGLGPKRGFPYTWIPNHLADTEGRVSPRSFLAALRRAVEHTQDEHSEHQHALHYDSIKRGVQAASEIRVGEMREDYPWIHRVLMPLAGKLVPCAFEEIAERWRQEEVLERLTEEVDQNEIAPENPPEVLLSERGSFGDGFDPIEGEDQKESRLLPRHLDQGPDGVRTDLEALGVFMRLRDGRVNIPDVFRVGYGLGRRGGVRPIR